MSLAVVSKAAQVKSINGKSIRLSLETKEEFQIGQKLLLVRTDGKKVGLVIIQSIGKGEAVAELIKGKAIEGATTLAKIKETSSSSVPANSSSTIGVYISGHQDSMSVTSAQNKKLSLAGQGTTAALALERPLSSSLKLRLGLEYTLFSVTTGQASQEQNLKVAYVGFRSDLNYFLTNNLFGGVGLNFLSPSKVTSRELFATDEVNPNLCLVIDFGYWFRLPIGAIPLTLNYLYFLDNRNVTASMLGLETGIAWRF